MLNKQRWLQNILFGKLTHRMLRVVLTLPHSLTQRKPSVKLKVICIPGKEVGNQQAKQLTFLLCMIRNCKPSFKVMIGDHSLAEPQPTLN